MSKKTIQELELKFKEDEESYSFEHSDKKKVHENIKDFGSLINFLHYVNKKQIMFADDMINHYLKETPFEKIKKENKELIDQLPEHIKENENMVKEIFFMVYKSMLLDTYATNSRPTKDNKNMMKNALLKMFSDILED